MNIHHLYELDYGHGSVEPFMKAFTMKHFLCPGVQILHNMLEFLRVWEQTTETHYSSFSCATLGVKNRQYIVVICCDNLSGFEAYADLAPGQGRDGLPQLNIHRKNADYEAGFKTENEGKAFTIEYQVDASIVGGLQMYTERVAGLDEDGGLDSQVERSRDPGTDDGLVVLVLLTEGHETGHLDLGDIGSR